MKRIKIGILGAGSFANRFIPLFQAHPLIEDVCFAERLRDRRQQMASKYHVRTAYESFEELLRSDVDAIALFSQRWTHAPQAIAAMRAGKHVYSAVPAAISLEELDQLIATVKETGQLYMMGETHYYTAPAIFCRKQFRAGQFGRFVYAQAGYLHDMEHGFYPPYEGANGPEWKKFASFPPMLYPTHSAGLILGVTGARMTRVSCLGQVDVHEDGIFDKKLSYFANDFSNETALFRSSDGGMCRTNEFRRVSGQDPLAVYGTLACFQNGKWIKHDKSVTDMARQLACAPEAKSADWEKQQKEGAQEDFFSGVSPMHDCHRLPKEFRGLPNGHGGSHQFLADDFARACVEEKLPVLNVWTAARFCAPGIVAHESALRDGESLPVPDFGDPPKGAAIMDLEQEEGKPCA
ncbi:MAG: 4-carboxy-2-hydroxymuconate-6-semialdehyde dehydrogenase [candidate division BRC1 bacterium ADurb.BinA364]|nr:MAG: 4-carboxy-2-hydroxymuconate-6-semialdehyde dehydrogenase [candidate division BRC1 bacterium ADurb.BinA364]